MVLGNNKHDLPIETAVTTHLLEVSNLPVDKDRLGNFLSEQNVLTPLNALRALEKGYHDGALKADMLERMLN